MLPRNVQKSAAKSKRCAAVKAHCWGLKATFSYFFEFSKSILLDNTVSDNIISDACDVHSMVHQDCTNHDIYSCQWFRWGSTNSVPEISSNMTWCGLFHPLREPEWMDIGPGLFELLVLWRMPLLRSCGSTVLFDSNDLITYFGTVLGPYGR